jgi:hypothetical protein
MVTKWQYRRDEVHGLEELDKQLEHWGGLGWELVTILHERQPDVLHGNTAFGAPIAKRDEAWSLIFKQPA